MKVMYNYETFLAFIWPPDAKSFFSVENTGYESNWHFSSPDLLVSSPNGNTMKPMTSVLVLNIFWHFLWRTAFRREVGNCESGSENLRAQEDSIYQNYPLRTFSILSAKTVPQISPDDLWY